MSKSIALGLLCAGALLLAALLTGCSDAPSPTPAPTPTPTMAPTHTPTPVPTPAAATLSLNVYLTLCAPRDLGLADDLTYGDFYSELAAEADRFEALTPPAQLSEWHLLNIEAYRTTQALVDIQPKDDVADFNSSFLIAVADDFGEKLSEAAARVPKDVRQPMIEAGCIPPADVPDDNEDVPYDYEDVPDDHGNDIDDATMAVVTVDVGGALDYVGDIDYFRFTAEEGQFYQIDVALGSLPDSVLALLNPDGWELAYNDDYGDSPASRVLWEAPASGDYYLVVEASGFDADVGTYTLTVSHSTIVDDHGNDIDDATVAAVGVDVEGVIDYPGDYDYFRFTAEEGQIYQIDVDLGSLPDSLLALLGPDGWELAYNDDHGDSWASRVVWLARESGVYYLVVESSGFDADVGTYTLTVSHSTIVDDHGDDVDDATAIRVGADVQGSLDYDGDIDYFRFQAEQGESYQIDVALGTLDDSIVYLYDGDGWFMLTNDDEEYWEAPSSGERYVTVEGYGIGTYTLTVSIIDDHGDDFESAIRIAIGEAVAIELEDIDDIDVLVFRARPGTEYVLTLNWESYSFRQSYTARPFLALFDADGQEHTRLMGYDFSGNRVPSIDLMWQAVTGGDYYIVVGDGNTVGTFTLTVTGGEETEQLDRDDATVAPTATPTPVPTPAAATLSLDEYLTLCVTTELELADDATFGDLSSLIAAEADRFEALTPPAQLSEWHLLNIEGFRTIQAFVELQPKDDVIDFIRFFLMAAISADSEEKLGEAAARLPEDVLQRMIEAGCIDPEDVPDDNEDVPYDNEDVLDDHGDDIDVATVAAVGADVEGAIGYLGDSDYFRFTAEEGQFYQIDVALGTQVDSELELQGADGWRLAYNDDHGDSGRRVSSGKLLVPASVTLRWRATA